MAEDINQITTRHSGTTLTVYPAQQQSVPSSSDDDGVHEEINVNHLQLMLSDRESNVNIDFLLDSAEVVFNDEYMQNERRLKNCTQNVQSVKIDFERIQALRMKISDYQLIKKIGKGAFGDVHLARYIPTKTLYALKMLKKSEMLKQSDSAFFWEERWIMAFSNSEWIVHLAYAFQDSSYLYMVMEYMPGGDLITLISRQDMNEDESRFYIAEIVLAVEAIHDMGYIHRDIKPDNILLDAEGHAKLADFGTCMKTGKDGCVRSETAVGTPDYISPEILRLQGRPGTFGVEIDWWSVGVVLYEMLVGVTPFYAESLVGTYGKIMNHKSSLSFSDDALVSEKSKKIISQFLEDKEKRLGTHGTDDIKSHTFFENDKWNFSNIRQFVPPVIPILEHDEDTSFFDDIDDAADKSNKCNLNADPQRLITSCCDNSVFIGFTFSNEKMPFSETKTRKQNKKRNLIDLRCIEKLESETNRTIEELQLKLRTADEELKRVKAKFESVTVELANEQRIIALKNANVQELLKKTKSYHSRQMETDAELSLLRRRVMMLEKQIEKNQKSPVEIDCRAEIQYAKVEAARLSYRPASNEPKPSVFSAGRAARFKTISEHASNGTAADPYDCTLSVTGFDNDDDSGRRVRQRSHSHAVTIRQTPFKKDLDDSDPTPVAQYTQESPFRPLHRASNTIRLNPVKTMRSQKPDIKQVIDAPPRCPSSNQQHFKSDSRNSSNCTFQRTPSTNSRFKSTQPRDNTNDSGITLTSFSLLESSFAENVDADLNDLYRSQLLEVSMDANEFAECYKDTKMKLDQALDRSTELVKQIRKLEKASSDRDLTCMCLQRQLDETNYRLKRLGDDMDCMQQKYYDTQKMLILKENQMNSLNQITNQKEADMRKIGEQLNELQDSLDSNQAEYSHLMSLYRTTEGEKHQLEVKYESMHLMHMESVKKLDAVLRAPFSGNPYISKINRKDYRLEKQLKKYEQMLNDERSARMKEEDRLIIDIRKLSDKLKIAEEESDRWKTECTKNAHENQSLKRRLHVLSRFNISSLLATRSASMIHRDPDVTLKPDNSNRSMFFLEESTQPLVHSSGSIIVVDRNDAANCSPGSVAILDCSRSNDVIDHRNVATIRPRNERPMSISNLSYCCDNSYDPSGINDDRLEGWLRIPIKLNIKKNGWKRQFVIAKAGRISFFNSDKDSIPSFIIRSEKLFHIRSVTQCDVMRLDIAYLPLIFQIVYDSGTQPVSELPNDSGGLSTSDSNQVSLRGNAKSYMGHSFITVSYRMPAFCEYCSKPCYHLLNPPPALECTQCHVKCHKHHIQLCDFPITECKVHREAKPTVLLVLCKTSEEQKRWIDSLSRYIDDCHRSHRESVS